MFLKLKESLPVECPTALNVYIHSLHILYLLALALIHSVMKP
jgi:hypothetical protein